MYQLPSHLAFSMMLFFGTLSSYAGIQAIEMFDIDASSPADGDKMLVCYYSRSRRLPSTSVPSSLCTHLMYAFADISPKGIAPKSSLDEKTYRDLASLKKDNPKLKVLISVQHNFSSVVDAGAVVIKSVSLQAVRFMRNYNFDGLNIDWEYPTRSQKTAFADFIQILSSCLHASNLSLSVALPNSPYRFVGYDADTLKKHVDLMMVMAYDFHVFNQKDNVTGYNSPLFAPTGEIKFFSAAGMVELFISLGLPPSKMLLGIPAFGRSWTLADTRQNGLHSPAIGKGAPAPYTGLSGLYIYADVCVAKQEGASLVKDTENVAEYLYKDTAWVAFDSIFTVTNKTVWALNRGLAGVGVWALQIDDAENKCGKGAFPLVNQIQAILRTARTKNDRKDVKDNQIPNKEVQEIEGKERKR